MNQGMLAGHLGADPEVRFTSSGQKVTTLRLAARVRKGGKDETIWWRVTIWGEQYDKMIAYLKKGSPVVVFGELSKPEIFTDRNGQPQISMNITAQHLSFSPFGKPESSASSEHHASSSHPSFSSQPEMVFAESAVQGQGAAVEPSFSDDEIPF